MGAGTQQTLLNVNTKEITPSWVDPNQPLELPENPLHYRAHKLQIILKILENQAQNNPAQFNSKNYRDLLHDYEKCCKAINEGLDEIPDERAMGEDGDEGTASEMGAGAPAGVDLGISSDNPFSGQGTDPA